MFSVSSILWPTDGSDESFKALEAAIQMARMFNAPLYALQVVQQVSPLVAGSGVAQMTDKGADVPVHQQELIKSTEKDLYLSVLEKVPRGVEVVSAVRVGEPSEVINEFVQEKNIGLIVMATEGRSGLSRFMTASVAEKTIRQSTIPALIIPAL